VTTKRIYGILVLINLLVLGVVFAHFYRSGAMMTIHRENVTFMERYKAFLGLTPFFATLVYLVFNYFLGFRPRRDASTIDEAEIES
jgi:hypothetical protein